MKPKVKDSDLQMCRNCAGTGMVKITDNHRVFDNECGECDGEGWHCNFKLKKVANPTPTEDVATLTGPQEVALQKEVLAWVKQKYNNNEAKFAAFLRFTMAYGRSQCDAKEFHGFLRDAFGVEGALHIVPKLAQLIKEKLYRVNLLTYNNAVMETQQQKQKKEAAKTKTKTNNTIDAATQKLVDQVGTVNNLDAFSVSAEPPMPPPIN